MGPRALDSKPTFLDVALAILLPPVGAYVWYRFQKEFWICLVLTILGIIPGIIYALYILLRPEPDGDLPLSTSSSPPSLFI